MSESADPALRQAGELLRASEERYRLIADNVGDVIWTAPVALSDSEKAVAKTDVAAVVDAVLDRWRFSFVSPAAMRVFGYAPEEIAGLSLHAITTPVSFAQVRQTMIEAFFENPLERVLPASVYESF